METKAKGGKLLVIMTALLWSLGGVCVKSIPWSPMSIMAARCSIGVLMLGAFNKSFNLKCNKKTFFGALMMSLTGIFYMISIKLTTAAMAIVLQYTAPVMVFLYTVIVNRVKPKLSEALIVLMVFGGCVLPFADQLNGKAIVGNLLSLASGVTFAAEIILFNDEESDSSRAMLVSNVMSFAVCLPFMFFDKNLVFNPKIIMWVLILGIFQYGLSNILYSMGCKRVSKLECSLLMTIEPIFSPIPVWLYTGEMMKPFELMGFVVVILGVSLYALLPKLTGGKKQQLMEAVQ